MMSQTGKSYTFMVIRYTKLSKYSNDVKDLFLKIRQLIYETNLQIDERIWASLPSFYYGKKFIRAIPFKDYVNIEAKSISEYREELIGYKITPKGMLRLEISKMFLVIC